MNTKHTPGPWGWVKQTEARQLDGAVVPLSEPHDYSLGPGVLLTDYTDGTPWGDEIDQANGRLIAAAPELLEALEYIVSSDMAQREEDEGHVSTDLVMARAAIFKAKGEE